MMISSHTPKLNQPKQANLPQQPENSPPPEPEDRFDLSGVPTAVKLYDMSPIWGPQPGEWKLPRGVRGLC